MLAFESAGDVLSLALSAGAILGGLGYAIGQFLSSRRRGVSDSLATAISEISALNQRAERLEKLVAEQATQIAAAKQENAILRSMITGGQPVIDEFDRRAEELKEFSRMEHEKTRAVIMQIRRDTAT